MSMIVHIMIHTPSIAIGSEPQGQTKHICQIRGKSELPCAQQRPWDSPTLTTGHIFLHSCLHFFGLHLHFRASHGEQAAQSKEPPPETKERPVS